MRCLQFNKVWPVFFLAFLLAGMGLSLSASAQDLRRYTFSVDLPRGGHLSGICLIRMEGDRGAMSVVNEFGVKAFDAVCPGAKGRVKLTYVMAPLDKWYIRRVLVRDLSVLFRPDRRLPRRRTLERREDGTLVLANRRHKITYRLKPLKDDAAE